MNTEPINISKFTDSAKLTLINRGSQTEGALFHCESLKPLDHRAYCHLTIASDQCLTPDTLKNSKE